MGGGKRGQKQIRQGFVLHTRSAPATRSDQFAPPNQRRQLRRRITPTATALLSAVVVSPYHFQPPPRGDCFFCSLRRSHTKRIGHVWRRLRLPARRRAHACHRASCAGGNALLQRMLARGDGGRRLHHAMRAPVLWGSPRPPHQKPPPVSIFLRYFFPPSSTLRARERRAPPLRPSFPLPLVADARSHDAHASPNIPSPLALSTGAEDARKAVDAGECPTCEAVVYGEKDLKVRAREAARARGERSEGHASARATRRHDGRGRRRGGLVD